MAVPIKTTPTFTYGNPHELFEGRYAAPDIHPDGDRFHMLQLEESGQTGPDLEQINIVLNWFEELKERVPVP